MPSCKKHPEQGLEQFCFDHRDVLCKTCKIIDHRNCKTDKISTLSSDPFFTNESKLKITSLKTMLAEFSRLEKMSEAKVVDLELQRKDAVKNVRKVKENINQYLDTLEKRMIADINQSVRHEVAQLSRRKQEIGCLIKELEKELEGYQEMQTEAFGSVHAFVMSINIEAEIGKYNAILNDIGVYLPDTKLEIDETLSNFQFQVQSFGNFEAVQTQKLQDESDIVYLTTVNIGSSVDKTFCKVNSIEMTSNGGLLVCDGGRNRVMHYDPTYKEVSEMSFLDTPYHLAIVSHDECIVALPDQSCLQYLKIKDGIGLELGSLADTMQPCYRLVKYDANLIAVADDGFFKYVNVLDKRGRVVKCIRQEAEGGEIKSIRDMSLSFDEKVIYITMGPDGCVGLSIAGDIVFRYKSIGMGEYPGVFAYSGGFVYIACTDKDKVVMVNRRGRKVKTLLQESGIKPTFMSYNEQYNRLFLKGKSSNAVYVATFM